MPLTLEKDQIEIHSRINQPPVISFWVIGERSTGTNFALDLITRNSELKPFPSMAWKHGFPANHVFPRRHVLIVTFREPMSWVKSMFAKPWEAALPMFKLEFSDFIRARWDSVYQQNYGIGVNRGPHEEKDFYEMPLMLDRHPIDGRAFHNILEMRNVKSRLFYNMHNRTPNVVYVHLDYLQKNPQKFLDYISRAYQFRLHEAFSPVDFHHGENRYWQDRKLKLPKVISASDRKFIIDQLDLEQEARMGFAIESTTEEPGQ